jgi:hypothetical protein
MTGPVGALRRHDVYPETLVDGRSAREAGVNRLRRQATAC